jgi:hypothetical protein
VGVSSCPHPVDRTNASRQQAAEVRRRAGIMSGLRKRRARTAWMRVSLL